MKERYHITGMTCSACSSHVEKSVNRLEGVEKASVNLLTETMDVSYDENAVNAGDIIRAVEKAGYGAEAKAAPVSGGAKEPSGGAEGEPAGRVPVRDRRTSARAGDDGKALLNKKAADEARAMKWRLGISIGFLIVLMYVAMYHMFRDWFGIPIPGFVLKAFHGNENAMTFALTQLLLLLPILYMNRKFFSVGFKTLAHLSPNMDSLIALGASAAAGYGVFAMYRISYGLGHGDAALVEHYSHDLYFESAGMILTLITVGKYLESRSKGKTSEAITKLMDLSPKTAIVLDEQGQEVELPTEALVAGDIFLVKPGSLVPADGTVLEGSSSIDEAAITGESVPVEKQQGDRVVSATINKSGFLKCRADRVGEDTTLSQIIHLVEEAGASKAPIAQMADKVAGVFVPVVIGIALLTLACWLMAGAGAEFAISSAIAVLVISCPCALGLATPVAIMVGTGVGAGHGILIKSGEALQQAGEIDTVVLDKTGTVTEGNLKVMETACVKEGMTERKLLALAAALESKSEHPLAEAVVTAAAEYPEKAAVTDFQAVFGRGIRGVLEADWLEKGLYLIGNLAYLEENGIKVSDRDRESMDRMADGGQTPLLAAWKPEADGARRTGAAGELLGIIGVADAIKESSRAAIEAWHKMNIRVIMLTGDNRRTAEAVRKKLGLEEVVAEVLPQEKEQKIRMLKERGGKVAMIGDGINDAPALAAADVGMAIGAGTDVAMESADVILMKSDLRDAVTAIRLSKAVIRNIRENLFWAFFYNSIGIPLAAGLLYPAFGLRLNPMFGAAAMSLSSIFVVGNALRLKGFKSGFGSRSDSDVSAAGSGPSGEGGQRGHAGVKESRININSNHNRKEEKNMKRVISIEGMSCGHCTARVQKALEAVEGVSAVEMSLEKKTAEVEAAEGVTDEALTAAVTEAGYEVTGVR